MTNLKRLQDQIAKKQIPALLVSDISNVQWASGFTGSSAFILCTPTQAIFITDSRYTVQSREEVKDMEIEVFASPTDSTTFIADNAKKLGIGKLGFEAATVTYATYEDWSKKMSAIELFPARDVLEPLRMVKTAEEIEKIRRACALADACFQHVQRLIQPGVSERDIALEIEFFFRRQGAGLAFPPIVVSGERSARPHGQPSERKLQKGDFVTMDFGANLDGYNSDITRTVVVQEASDRHREIYNAVLEAQMAALSALGPGKPAAEVDGVSRKVLAKHQLDGYFGHGLGHGLGKSVHDFGRMNATSKDHIEPGQVWTIEPGVYIEGFGGVRIEDDAVITADGHEVLTHSPKELLVLPRA